MSFTKCINNSKALTRGQKRNLLEKYERLTNKYKVSMGDEQAAAQAAKNFVDIELKRIRQEKANTILDIIAWERLKEEIRAGEVQAALLREQAGKGAFLFGKSNVGTAVRSKLESIYTRHMGLERRATLAMGELIEKYRSKHAGITQETGEFKEIVRHLIDGDTGGKLGGDARAIREVFDMLLDEYRAAGGIVGRLENWFPQRHDGSKFLGADSTAWKRFIKPLLDENKMVDIDTGLPLTEAKLDELLDQTYEGIRTNGLNELSKRANEGKQTFGTGVSIAKRHAKSRFLHFKDAESFFKYNDEYGYGDKGLFDSMLSYVHSITRDTALMQELGPNPTGQMARMKMLIEAEGASPQVASTAQGMYDVLSGRTSYRGDTGVFYKTVRGIQDWLRSAYLVGAPIAAMSDTAYLSLTAKMNGLPTMGVMKRYLSFYNPTSAADRRMARRLGYIAGAANATSLGSFRVTDDLGSRGLTGWLASFTNRASGLQSMTDNIKSVLPISTFGFMAEAKHTNMKWNELPPAMQEAFGRWGMDESDFKNIVNSKAYVDYESKADFIRPEDVAAAGHVETAAKYDMWINDMAQTASNEPRLLTRAITTGAAFGDATEGTALRLTASTMMMFKSFGMTVVMNHLLGSMRHAATARGLDRLSRIAPMLVATTMMGMISLQARQITQGKTPREVDKKMVMASVMQGGGFGIFGDFIFSDTSRYGADLAKTIMGPAVSFTNDAWKVPKKNFDRWLDGDETQLTSDLWRFSERNIPAAKLWYIRLLSERLMLDQVSRMADPNFDKRVRRMERQARKDYGQESWWGKGNTLPDFMD
jgi:hypothetical protein